MVLKTLKNKPKDYSILKAQDGITIVEILMVFTIMALLMAFVYLYVRPNILYANSRDTNRLSDIQTLDRAVNEYMLDTEAYPGVVDVLYTSNTVPVVNSGPVESASSGWIEANLSKYFSVSPVDPTNSGIYIYRYQQSGSGYEIDIVLENSPELMSNDGGDDVNTYELGNDLTIL